MAKNILFNTALNKAMAMCANREMCNSDITQKLISWGIGVDASEKILNLLTQGKFIDEERYAVAFVKDRFRYNKWGKLKIGAALKMKKIPGEIISKALESINDEEYIDLLKSIIIKRRKTVKAEAAHSRQNSLGGTAVDRRASSNPCRVEEHSPQDA